MIRAVTDTNVLISALFFGGVPRQIVRAALDKRILLVTSERLLTELDRVLQRKFEFVTEDARLMQLGLRGVMRTVTPLVAVNAVAADADDNKVIECAIAGQADCIVSGDRHLKELKVWEGIEIITPREFVDRYL